MRVHGQCSGGILKMTEISLVIALVGRRKVERVSRMSACQEGVSSRLFKDHGRVREFVVRCGK